MLSGRLREGLGALLVLFGLGALWFAIDAVGNQEFVAALLLITTGLSVLRAGVELLRPTLGE